MFFIGVIFEWISVGYHRFSVLFAALEPPATICNSFRRGAVFAFVPQPAEVLVFFSFGNKTLAALCLAAIFCDLGFHEGQALLGQLDFIVEHAPPDFRGGCQFG